MKNNTQIAILIVLLTAVSCQQLKDGNTISPTLDHLSKKEHCMLGYIDQSVGDATKLTVKFNCEKKDDFFPGKLILSVFESLNAKKIVRQ